MYILYVYDVISTYSRRPSTLVIWPSLITMLLSLKFDQGSCYIRLSYFYFFDLGHSQTMDIDSKFYIFIFNFYIMPSWQRAKYWYKSPIFSLYVYLLHIGPRAKYFKVFQFLIFFSNFFMNFRQTAKYVLLFFSVFILILF